MSQKAWMQAYTRGSKSLQDRLAKVHRNNPEFQDFVKKHGFGGNLSVKQSGLQKKPSVATVKPTDAPNPERGNLDREALIKAAAEKIKNRRMANANRVAFGGELGGGFSMPGGGFRRYSESIDETVAANFRKIVPGLGKLQAKNRAMDLDKELDQGIIAKKFTRKERMRRAKHIERFARVASGENAFKRVNEASDEEIMKVNRKKNKAVILAAHKKLLSKGYTHIHTDGVSTPFDGYDTRHHYLSKNGTHKKIMRYDAYSVGYNTKPRISIETERLSRKHPDLKENFELHEDLVEDISYKDGQISMYRGGWIAKRNGKRIGTNVPSKEHAQGLIDNTYKSLTRKTMDVVKKKAREVMSGLGRHSLATESAANRRRIRSWDSAILKDRTNPNSVAALRAAGKHVEARELERAMLRKALAKEKTENSK